MGEEADQPAGAVGPDLDGPAVEEARADGRDRQPGAGVGVGVGNERGAVDLHGSGLVIG